MKKGFTLIELLIVVAIIAILAAIAVPNFLEAQTRSKIARVRADLRTLGIAINSYRVDTNHNPPGYTTIGVYNSPDNSNRHRAYKHMTTPISYISQFPVDPFHPPTSGLHPNGKGGYTAGRPEAKYYFYNNFSDPANKHQGPPPEGPNDSNGAIQKFIDASGFTWGAYSAGPMRVEFTPSMETAIGAIFGGGSAVAVSNAYASIYDPTNGTVSFGRLAYTNKGFIDERGWF